MYAADSAHSSPVLAEKLRSLYTLRNGPSIDLTIRKPYRDLLAALGNPHEDLPPVIHVAGTNGKGSVIAILRAIFEAAGYSVHAYTSPHLVRFNERIVLGGVTITDEDLELLLDEVLGLVETGQDLTFFEITTAMAFAAFSRAPADILLLETGLGGRLDCTNIIEHPLATVITPVGYDHTEFLGETLSAIAAEKAGIMKAQTPCILAPQDNEDIIALFRSMAAEKGVPLYRYGVEWGLEDLEGRLCVHFGDTEEINCPYPALSGRHQFINTALALTCLRAIQGFTITGAAVEKALLTVKWPGRLQHLDSGVLGTSLPEGWALWVDGGHNKQAARVLSEQLQLWQQQDARPVHLVWGMMKTKDPAAFLEPLIPYLAHVTTLAIEGEALSYSADHLAQCANQSGAKSVHTALNLQQAIYETHRSEPCVSRVLVAGSLYLAGQVLTQNGTVSLS